MWQSYINATSIEEAIQILTENPERSRIVAGATDLILEMERGVKKNIDVLIDVTRIPQLDQVTLDPNGILHIGPLVTHHQAVSSKLIREYAYPLARACWEVGSPQIRNRGTIAGNLITASPANDTITPLMALGAVLTLRSTRGERRVPLAEFYQGVRRTALAPDEMLVDITIPALNEHQKGTFVKFALRKAQAISVVNVAIVLTLVEDTIQDARITLGAVAPTIVRATEAETYLTGKKLDEETIKAAAERTITAARPINDLRGSAAYRKAMVRVMTLRGLRALAQGKEREGFPEHPVFLWGKNLPHAGAPADHARIDSQTPIHTWINGKEYTFDTGQNKTLLRLLREEGELIGSKEGCAEGECGACTLYLNGVAVMGCLVPAPRADGAQITTIEGLADKERYHPVQAAFIDAGAVQCGYCIPGFLMSSAKLLEERPHPDRNAIEQAISGNLCRCTGYYKIIEAIELAATQAATKE